MKPEKAEIIGLLSSDGNYRKYRAKFTEYDKRRHNIYYREQTNRIIEFANTDMSLLKTFQNILFSIYRYKPNIHRSNHNVFRICIIRWSVIDDILKYVSLGTERWYIHKKILNGSPSVRKSFIRGFFDGDGSVDFVGKTPRIRITSTNSKGLRQIKKILDDFKIECKINGPYKRNRKKDSYELLLKTKNIKDFIRCIGYSNYSKKKKRLLRLIK